MNKINNLEKKKLSVKTIFHAPTTHRQHRQIALKQHNCTNLVRFAVLIQKIVSIAFTIRWTFDIFNAVN